MVDLCQYLARTRGKEHLTFNFMFCFLICNIYSYSNVCKIVLFFYRCGDIIFDQKEDQCLRNCAASPQLILSPSEFRVQFVFFPKSLIWFPSSEGFLSAGVINLLLNRAHISQLVLKDSKQKVKSSFNFLNPSPRNEKAHFEHTRKKKTIYSQFSSSNNVGPSPVS